jgi:hypothetical protein
MVRIWILLPTVGLAAAGVALIVLTPVSFELLAGITLVLLLGSDLRMWRQRHKPIIGLKARLRTPKTGLVIAEIGATAMAAVLMYFAADFSALAALLILGIGFASATSFWLLLWRVELTESAP